MSSKIKQNQFCDVKKLKSILESRNLIVDNINILYKVNYSHLIHKYGKFYFSEKGNKAWFKSEITLSNIYNFYLFNNNFSSIIFKFILKFEHKIKQSVAYHFAEINELCYKDKDFFTIQKPEDQEIINKLIKDLEQIEINTKEKYNKNSYYENQLPIWLLIDELNFSQLRMLIRFSKRIVKSKIINDLKIKIKNSIILETIHKYRNLLFHANPLKKKIKNKINKRSCYLDNLIKYIHSNFKDEYLEMCALVNSYDFEKNMNLTKDDFLKFLGLDNFFEQDNLKISNSLVLNKENIIDAE